MTLSTKEMKIYMREYRAGIKERIIALLGGKCFECDSVIKLKIHHLDPKTKRFTIARNWTRKFETNLEEIKKCILLCEVCHNNEHRTFEHGTTLYKQGCRCPECYGAQSSYRHDYYLRTGK
jgi:5-methylcytosine-specific restriction endonuclease McrA